MIMVRDVAAYGITDIDFYVDLSDIYSANSQQIEGLGSGSSDVYGEGYDVQTSARVNTLVMSLIFVFTMMDDIQTLLIQVRSSIQRYKVNGKCLMATYQMVRIGSNRLYQVKVLIKVPSL